MADVVDDVRPAGEGRERARPGQRRRAGEGRVVLEEAIHQGARRCGGAKRLSLHGAVELDGLPRRPVLRKENLGEHELPRDRGRVRGLRVAERLVDEDRRVGARRRREPPHRDVGLHVQAVRHLAVDAVSVPVPGAVEIGVIGVGRDLLGERERHAHEAERDGLVVSGQDGPPDAPQVARGREERTDRLGQVVRARIGGADGGDSPDHGRPTDARLVVGEPLEDVGERIGRDDDAVDRRARRGREEGRREGRRLSGVAEQADTARGKPRRGRAGGKQGRRSGCQQEENDEALRGLNQGIRWDQLSCAGKCTRSDSAHRRAFHAIAMTVRPQRDPGLGAFPRPEVSGPPPSGGAGRTAPSRSRRPNTRTSWGA